MRILFSFLGAAASANADVSYFSTPPIAADPGITIQNLVLYSERQGNIKAILTLVKNPVGFVHTLPPTPEVITFISKEIFRTHDNRK